MKRVEIRIAGPRLLAAAHRLAPAAIAAGLAAGLGGCAGPLSTLDPAGPAARSISVLMLVLLVLAALSFVVIFGLFLLALRRRRSRAVSQRLFLVGGGLVFPLVLLSVATIYGVVLGERIIGARERPALSIEARAERWHWQFTREGQGGSVTRRDILDVPAGRTVEIVVTSADVIHSFWVPRLAGKIDAIPGMRNRILIRADVPGRYGGVCAEFCGTGHAEMGFTLVAHDPEAWADLERGAAR
ncbi:cytochrome c oxidase subunit II [Enterovirga rhinocerotis]|uniref:cytochrome c oxidase subunit II n=1 Tax=Enterovirga rhinocerotis TaxID=1339210 RepID=UPI00105F63E3|nr:cytochrome c oxidase subunit II [Enterovirga rhinocerotis]